MNVCVFLTVYWLIYLHSILQTQTVFPAFAPYPINICYWSKWDQNMCFVTIIVSILHSLWTPCFNYLFDISFGYLSVLTTKNDFGPVDDPFYPEAIFKISSNYSELDTDYSEQNTSNRERSHFCNHLGLYRWTAWF